MPVDKSNDRIQHMFGEIAPRYDFLNHLLSLGIDLHWRRQTVRRVRPEGTAPVLDLCAGTGDLALAYFRHGREAAPIVAADFCPQMLAIGRRKGIRAGAADRLTFVEADAQQLPFPDNEFQIVAVAFGLRNIADTDRGLREMVRVCRSGGRVAVLEFAMPQRQPWHGMYRWYFRSVLPRIGQLFARHGSAAYKYLPSSVGEFPSGRQLAERMEAAGLTDVEITPLTFGVAMLYVGRKGRGTRDEGRRSRSVDVGSSG
ncbi:MAG TPA: bifunctional demethylmenaquinone methyltransferase/2-methoxy-6-polyprenyl-1,4-benzoquinol methylase UbiE [Pirellulales bacterium]|nr:bifunctional demethylmenaquinone methyltransferase/2-methoxy-6-polyprenyl-1,4-benzoquinol methylase UbiE [Pirellulales bacterium]